MVKQRSIQLTGKSLRLMHKPSKLMNDLVRLLTLGAKVQHGMQLLVEINKPTDHTDVEQKEGKGIPMNHHVISGISVTVYQFFLAMRSIIDVFPQELS